MRVKVGDIVLDQFQNTIIAQNFEVNGFGDLSTRNGGFSNDFVLPLSIKNEEALGFPSDLNISTREPYQKVDAQLIDVGAVVALGYLRYKKIEDKTIRCAFFEGNTEWFNLIKDKKMIELNLSVFDHDWTHTVIAAAINADKNSGYFYPIIDYGYWIDATLSTTTLIPSDQFFPAMFVHSLVHQIFADIGWTVAGEIHNYTADTPYRRMIQPFSAADFVKTQQYLDDNTINLTEFETTDVGTGSNRDVNWSSGASIINVLSNDDYTIAVILNVTWTGDDLNSTTVRIKKGAVTLKIDATPIANGQTIDLLIETTGLESLLTTDDITVNVEITTGTGVLVFNSGSILIAPTPKMIAGNNVEMSATMPDMLQTEFLQYLFFSLGIVPQTDNYSKTVDLDLFRTIEDNIPSAIDWSDKLDTSKKIVTDFTQLLNKYSRVSIMNYEVDDDDPELSAYLAETQTNFGQGQFDIDNAHLDPIKEIYTAPYVPMININSWSNEMYLPQIKFYVEDPDNPGTFLKEFEPKAKIAIASENISLQKLTIEVTTTFRIHVPGDAATFTDVTSAPFTWFAKTSYITEIDAILDSLVYDQINFSNVIGNTLKNTYLSDQEDILNDMKGIKAFFRLTEVDVINIDFLIPIYVNKFKSYFYRNKIKNYQGSNKSTQVELIRIGNG